MRFVIYGAGGIGGGIGAQLALSGFETLLIARGEHLRRIRENGLRLLTPEGDTTLALSVAGHPSEVAFRPEDVVICTMKSQDTRAALDDLRAHAPASLMIVMAQNGVSNEVEAARRFERVYAMMVHTPAQFLEPGCIALHGRPKRGVLDAGRFPNGVDPAITEVCRALAAAGFASEPRRDVMRLKYGKLLLNLGNAAQAVCGLDADLSALTRSMRAEAMECFEAAGIDFISARDLVDRCRGHYELGEIEGVPRQGGSSWQGLVRGTGSIESDFLNGEIVLLGTRFGVPTPLNRTVQRLAVAAAGSRQAPGSVTVEQILDEAGSGPGRVR